MFNDYNYISKVKKKKIKEKSQLEMDLDLNLRLSLKIKPRIANKPANEATRKNSIEETTTRSSTRHQVIC